MGECDTIVPPHLNAESYRNNTVFSDTTPYLDYIQMHADGTALIGFSELTGRYGTGGVKVFKTVAEAKEAPATSKVTIKLSSGTADGCFIADSNKLLLCEDNGSLSVWNHSEGAWSNWEELVSVSEHDDAVLVVKCLEPAQHYITAGNDGNIKIWDINEMICDTNIAHAHSMLISGVAVKPTSTCFATASLDCYVSLWDSKSKDKVKDLVEMDCGVRCIEWIDEHRLLMGDEAGTISLVDIRNTPTYENLMTLPAPVHRILYQAETRNVAVCCDNKTVSVYTLSETFGLKDCYKDKHNNYVRGLAWDNSNSSMLHSVGWDGSLRTHNINC